ncbi:hypothetical protein LSH36_119g08092 [Paralvinella palmiformis]|uniref:Uncharacterized protein n=1 Tax=Paralvinella palmiformis TaxID=53620 RepID=A0AAD9JYB9_9ANNE|nr:hypothetical protein LSH36_119g08092 [Paralvinella palmiformis]
MADENDLGFLARFANSLGASENIFRLILSLIAGYPLAAIHRKLFYGKSTTYQHLYFIVSGILLGYFNFGTDVIHSVINILLNYAILLIWNGTRISVGLSFVINLVSFGVISVFLYIYIYILVSCAHTHTHTYTHTHRDKEREKLVSIHRTSEYHDTCM